jgi:hypothetical protein
MSTAKRWKSCSHAQYSFWEGLVVHCRRQVFSALLYVLGAELFSAEVRCRHVTLRHSYSQYLYQIENVSTG